ncbi:MAG: putative membrane protein [Parcubacteria bacterium C7867-008]|nr:MAG: putative membrane protein [Parcubacteria bacterium C7867-008]
MSKRVLKWTLVLAVIAALLFFLSIQPRTDRNWSEEFSRTATATTLSNGHIALSNVRDWTYGNGTITSKEWRTVEVDPKAIKKVWFVTEPFSQWKAVGHTFLSFEFKDGTTLSFSIEARREAGEDYSAIRGLFKSYELSYQWGTERDFITRRMLYLDHPVRRYPLAITSTMSEALFRGSVNQTNELATRPRFYNTLTENCTNALAHIVNDLAPKTLPYNISWNLTGYADQYLMEQGFIKLVEGTQETTRNHFELTSYKDQVLKNATADPEDFSAFLDSLLTVTMN